MQPTVSPTATSTSFWGRHEFLIRRLHSLSGLVPVGAYMCVHLATNASVLAGAATFQDQVDAIHALGPVLPLVEWTFIFLPLIFHAVVGVAIAVYCENNAGTYRYGSNVRYVLQRATAWIALFFIFWHVFHMHGWIHNDAWMTNVARPLWGGQFDARHATSSSAIALGPLLAKLVYFVGVLACVYHLANGLWTMGITWGVWTTQAAMRRANYWCAAFGVLLAAVGLAALAGMSTVDVEHARAVEAVRLEQERETELRIRRRMQSEQPVDRTAGSNMTSEGHAPPR